MDVIPFLVVFAPANNKTDHVMHHQTVAPVRLYDEAVEAVTAMMSESPFPSAVCEVEEHLHIPGGTLSELFADERDLLLAMAERAIALLHDQCVRTVVTVDGHDPVAQFQALADAYIEWAYRFPREFRIIGSMPGSEFGKNGRLRVEKSGTGQSSPAIVKMLPTNQVVCLSGRSNRTFTFKQNWIAVLLKTDGPPLRPALGASHTISLSSQISSEPRRFNASL